MSKALLLSVIFLFQPSAMVVKDKIILDVKPVPGNYQVLINKKLPRENIA